MKKEILYRKEGLIYFFANLSLNVEKGRLCDQANSRCWQFRQVFLGIVFLCFVAVFYIFGFFVAKRPSFLENDPRDCTFVKYKNWPTIKGHRIWPVSVLSLLALIYFIYRIILIMPAVISNINWATVTTVAYGIFVFSTVIVFLIVVPLSIVFFFLLIQRFFKSELGLFVKDGICPMVRFVSRKEKK